MNNRKEFEKNLNRAAKARLEGQAEVYQRLRNQPLEQLAKVSPKDFACLSENQLQSLLGVKQTAHSESKAEDVRKSVWLSPWWWLLKWLTTRFPPIFVAAAVASMVLASGIGTALLVEAAWPTFQVAKKRSADARTWPLCPRLSPETNGCIYQVQRELAWDDAAYFLEMPMTALKAENSHLSDYPVTLPQGSQIIVWRQRNPN